MDINFSNKKDEDKLFSKFPEKIKSLQWHSYEVQGIEKNKDVTLLASSPVTKYQIFKYKNHAYGIQFHIEIKDTTVNEWGCVPEYKKALEDGFSFIGGNPNGDITLVEFVDYRCGLLLQLFLDHVLQQLRYYLVL